jgi:hypothetical protein
MKRKKLRFCTQWKINTLDDIILYFETEINENEYEKEESEFLVNL